MTQMVAGSETRLARGSLRIDVAAVAVASILILTTLLKLTLFARFPLAVDEVWTGMIASQSSWAGLIHQCDIEVSAPLGYVISWEVGRIIGVSNVALRAPELAFALTAPLIALVAGRTLPRTVRLTWCVLTACWLPGLMLAQEARPYSLVIFLAMANSVAFVALWRAPRLRTALVWSTLSALLILSHYAAVVLVGLQGLAYLAGRRKAALRTWPAALAFVPALTSLGLKAVVLTRFAKPGIAWIPLLRLADLPALAAYLLGAWVVVLGVAIWVGIGLASEWRRLKGGRTPTRDNLGGAILVTALLALAAAGVSIGLGFLRPMVTARYLTPEVPGVLLGLALLGHRFSRSWALMPVLLATGFAGLCLGFLIHPLRLKAVFSFQPAAEMFMADGVRHVAFMWDNPITQGGENDQLAQVAGFFFKRAGRSIKVDVVNWSPLADPNQSLLNLTRGTDDGLIWIYDRDVLRTGAITHPPRLTVRDPGLRCRDFGGGRIGVLACDRRHASY
jgi:hypothetical protein